MKTPASGGSFADSSSFRAYGVTSSSGLPSVDDVINGKLIGIVKSEPPSGGSSGYENMAELECVDPNFLESYQTSADVDIMSSGNDFPDLGNPELRHLLDHYAPTFLSEIDMEMPAATTWQPPSSLSSLSLPPRDVGAGYSLTTSVSTNGFDTVEHTTKFSAAVPDDNNNYSYYCCSQPFLMTSPPTDELTWCDGRPVNATQSAIHLRSWMRSSLGSVSSSDCPSTPTEELLPTTHYSADWHMPTATESCDHRYVTTSPSCLSSSFHCSYAVTDSSQSLSPCSELSDRELIDRVADGLPAIDNYNSWAPAASDDNHIRSALTNSMNPGDKNSLGAWRSRGRRRQSVCLWQFLRELLYEQHPDVAMVTDDINSSISSNSNSAITASGRSPVKPLIRWLDKDNGVFKIEDSVRIAKLWGERKNRPAMNYDKLSRSIRQYYKHGIIKKTSRSRRLVFQFCPQYI